MNPITRDRKRLLENMLESEVCSTLRCLQNRTPEKITIYDDGRIIFYYNKWKWWASLLGQTEVISMSEVCLEIADRITGAGHAKNRRAFNGMINDIIPSIIGKKDYNKAIDVIYDHLRHSFPVSNNDLQSHYWTIEDQKVAPIKAIKPQSEFILTDIPFAINECGDGILLSNIKVRS